MIPATGDFDVITAADGLPALRCPKCRQLVFLAYFPAIRDLINAASAHANTHALSEAGSIQ